MTRPRPRRLVFTSLFGLTLLAASSALFVNCTPTDHANAPTADCRKPGGHHGPRRHPRTDTSDGGPPNIIYCRGDVDCADSEWFPVCGDYDMATCIAPNTPPYALKECIFRVSEDTGCFCLERDIRACTTTSNTAGIQHCEATGAWSTGWGTCS